MLDYIYINQFQGSSLQNSSSVARSNLFHLKGHNHFSSNETHRTRNIDTSPYFFTDPELKFSIYTDSRIDNRTELAQQLNIPSIISKSWPDKQLILEAYKRWNVSCFNKLLGDFSVVIEDRERNKIICARDIFGVKPLYYYHTGNSFIASTDVKSIVDHPKVKNIPNIGFIAELLTHNILSNSETLYSNIHRVPAAHYLVISYQNITLKKYWEINPNHRIRYQKMSEYTEHFNDVFAQSVQARLEGSSIPCSELSGGLDSSLVVATANHILSSQNTENRLQTFTLRFKNCPFDETQYVEAFVDFWDKKATYVDCDFFNEPDWKGDVLRHYYLPHSPNQHMNSVLLNCVSKNGHNIILSGIGGDEWFTGSTGYASLDILSHFGCTSASQLLKEFRFQLTHGHSKFCKKFHLALIWPFIPSTLKKLLCRTRRPHFPEWIPQKFIQKSCLLDRIHDADTRYKTNFLSLSQMFHLTTTGVESFFLEDFYRFKRRFELEPRYPFLDRRVVEFAFAIPEFIRNDKGWPKVIIRQAGKNILPKKILDRWDKAEFSYFFGRAFNSQMFKDQMRQSQVGHLGWINSEVFQQQLKLCQNAYQTNPYTYQPHTWQIWHTFAIETWLTTMF